MNLSIFTVFMKNKNIIFKIRRSKVTDYAALRANINISNSKRGCLSWEHIFLFSKLPFSKYYSRYTIRMSFNWRDLSLNCLQTLLADEKRKQLDVSPFSEEVLLEHEIIPVWFVISI